MKKSKEIFTLEEIPNSVLADYIDNNVRVPSPRTGKMIKAVTFHVKKPELIDIIRNYGNEKDCIKHANELGNNKDVFIDKLDQFINNNLEDLDYLFSYRFMTPTWLVNLNLTNSSVSNRYTDINKFISTVVSTYYDVRSDSFESIMSSIYCDWFVAVVLDTFIYNFIKGKLTCNSFSKLFVYSESSVRLNHILLKFIVPSRQNSEFRLSISLHRDAPIATNVSLNEALRNTCEVSLYSNYNHAQVSSEMSCEELLDDLPNIIINLYNQH